MKIFKIIIYNKHGSVRARTGQATSVPSTQKCRPVRFCSTCLTRKQGPGPRPGPHVLRQPLRLKYHESTATFMSMADSMRMNCGPRNFREYCKSIGLRDHVSEFWGLLTNRMAAFPDIPWGHLTRLTRQLNGHDLSQLV